MKSLLLTILILIPLTTFAQDATIGASPQYEKPKGELSGNIPHPKYEKPPAYIPTKILANEALNIDRRGIEPDMYIYLYHATLTKILADKQKDERVKNWLQKKQKSYFNVWDYCVTNPDTKRYTLIGKHQELAKDMIKRYKSILEKDSSHPYKNALIKAIYMLNKIMTNQFKEALPAPK